MSSKLGITVGKKKHINLFFCVHIDKYSIVVNDVLCSWSGISEEKTLNPVQLATMKAERIAREKAAAAQVRKELLFVN